MKKGSGFTLLEIMVVLAIMAGAMMIVIPRLTNNDNRVRKTLRELQVLSRELHIKAKLKGTTYRLVIDLSDGPDSNGQKFWVEKSNTSTLIPAGEDTEDAQKDEDEKKKKGPFSIDTEILKEPELLPSGLSFSEVELSRLKQPITKGKAYIHYLPQGLVEEAAVHLKSGDKNEWTMTIEPLTGRTILISKSMSLKELKRQ